MTVRESIPYCNPCYKHHHMFANDDVPCLRIMMMLNKCHLDMTKIVFGKGNYSILHCICFLRGKQDRNGR